ncbi:TPA: Cell division cycle protein 27 [Trebouxia sp. C0006]
MDDAAAERHMVACVNESLSLYLMSNARFMCERLVADYPSEANTFLLATCCYRSDQAHRAYHLLMGSQDVQSRWLLAQCCMSMNKYTEAEQALNPNSDGTDVPNGAAGFYLLGKICRLTNRHKVAQSYHKAALTLDPLLWSAYEELCMLGGEDDAAQLLSNEHALARNNVGMVPEHGTPLAQHNINVGPPPSAAIFQQGGRGMEVTPLALTSTSVADQFPVGRQLHQNDYPMQTPSPGVFVTPSPSGYAHAAPPALPYRAAPPPRGVVTSQAATPSTHPAPSPTQTGASNSQRWKFMDDTGKLRKVSGRLFSEPSATLRRGSRVAPAPLDSAQKVQAALQARQHRETQMALERRALTGATASTSGASQQSPEMGAAQGQKTPAGHAAVLQLLQTIGEAYSLLSKYHCQEATVAFHKLSPAQFNTGWVLCQLGRAYYEMVDYPAAANVFEFARQADRHRLEGLEVYSTVLWHMKREVEVSYLAQEAIAQDRRSPHAWAIMGNCFSLQKEHENALKFFQRALQLDPSFTYAYTLAGHEYFANEDFDKGLQCYRHAMRLDPRHYNAWYGVGQIYFRQEKYEMAEYHFRRSLLINQRSSVLRCYVGVALHKIGRAADALEQLQSAIDADPKNPLAKFEKAAVLMSQEQYQPALLELEALKEIAPNEASVWFQMGKIYKKLEQHNDALRHFNTALDLKPSSSDSNLIKSAIEKIRISDESDDEEI